MPKKSSSITVKKKGSKKMPAKTAAKAVAKPKSTAKSRNKQTIVARKSSTGTGGVKQARSFNWKRAVPIIALLALVGGIVVLRSFAASPTSVSPGKTLRTISAGEMTVGSTTEVGTRSGTLSQNPVVDMKSISGFGAQAQPPSYTSGWIGPDTVVVCAIVYGNPGSGVVLQASGKDRITKTATIDAASNLNPALTSTTKDGRKVVPLAKVQICTDKVSRRTSGPRPTIYMSVSGNFMYLESFSVHEVGAAKPVTPVKIITPGKALQTILARDITVSSTTSVGARAATFTTAAVVDMSTVRKTDPNDLPRHTSGWIGPDTVVVCAIVYGNPDAGVILTATGKERVTQSITIGALTNLNANISTVQKEGRTVYPAGKVQVCTDTVTRRTSGSAPATISMNITGTFAYLESFSIHEVGSSKTSASNHNTTSWKPEHAQSSTDTSVNKPSSSNSQSASGNTTISENEYYGDNLSEAGTTISQDEIEEFVDLAPVQAEDNRDSGMSSKRWWPF